MTAHDVRVVQQLVAERGDWTRSAQAHALCEQWQWRATNGAWKLRSALDVLLGLEARGWITLPPLSRSVSERKTLPRVLAPAESLPTRRGVLSELRPLCWQRVRSAAQGREWRELLNRHHYLGAPRLVGASLRYLVFGRKGELLGALGWQSAVLHLECRDRLIGWTSAGRAEGLGHLVNNVRFLIAPWVEVPHLASATLGESLEHLRRDWWEQYHRRVWLAETFIDRERFSGASYRAANWVSIGWTRGFARHRQRFVYHGQTKEVYVYVFEPQLRRWAHAEPHQPLLTQSFLLTQPPQDPCATLVRRKRMQEIQESWTPKLPPRFHLAEDDIKDVAQELIAFTQQFQQAFERVELRDLCTLYLQGLLSNTERKNAEAMALALDGPKRVRGLQRFMCDYVWDQTWIRSKHWELCAQELSDPQGVWCIDASEIPKKGSRSVGVAAQYCGNQGKTANCQSGVFVAYTSPKGHALLDARLYLPKCWFQDEYAERRKACRVPKEVDFQTKPQLALDLLKTLWKGGLFTAQWVTCDASFGNNEDFLDQLPTGCLYLAEIPSTRKVWVKHALGHPELETAGGTVEQLVGEGDLLEWQNRKLAEGEKGPIVAGFSRVRVYLRPERTPESERWLWLRNNPDGQIKYALSNAPEDIPMTCMIRVSIARWPIEQCFQEGKSDLGLDHYEHRSWTAWHRHMRLVFLAQLFLLRLQSRYKKSPGTDPFPSAAPVGVESAESAAGSSVRRGIHPLSPSP